MEDNDFFVKTVIPKKVGMIFKAIPELMLDPQVGQILAKEAYDMFSEYGTVIDSTVTSEVREPNPANPADYDRLEDGTSELTSYHAVLITAEVIPHAG